MVQEAYLAALRKSESLCASGNYREIICSAQGNLSISYGELGRFEDALRLQREVYDGFFALFGPTDERTINAGNNINFQLMKLERCDEAKRFARTVYRAAQALNANSHHRILAGRRLANALMKLPHTRADLLEAEQLIVDAITRMRWALGPQHPETKNAVDQLACARELRELLDRCPDL